MQRLFDVTLIKLNLPLLKVRNMQMKKVLFISFSEKHKKSEVKMPKMVLAPDTNSLPQPAGGKIIVFIDIN